MTTRRRALLALAGLVVPGVASAQPPKPPPAPPSPPTKAQPTARPSSHKAAKAPSRAAPPPERKPNGSKAPGKSPSRVRPATIRARPAPPTEPSEPAAEAAPPPRRPVRLRDDRPTLRPLDRDLVRGWLAANPDWRSPGPAQPLAEGKPLPPGLPRQSLPPGLAMLLPYFPGYRYAAIGPDLVLYAAATEQVASVLPGALAR